MDSLMKSINTIARCGILYRAQALSAQQLNGHQHAYILRICQQPGISQEELTREIYVHKSNVARQLAALEAGGFIRREPAEQDRRALRIFPTEKALEVYPQVRKVLSHWNAYLMEALPQAQRDTLVALLSQVADKAKAYVDENRGEGLAP